MTEAEIEAAIAGAEQRLRQARSVLSTGAPHTMDSYDWLLVVTCLAGADERLASVPGEHGEAQRELLTQVLEELREMTDNFRLSTFLSASKAGRRGAPHLFEPRRPRD